MADFEISNVLGAVRFILLGLFTFVFAYASGLQINDPDSFLWMGVYGVASLLTAAELLGERIDAQLVWSFVVILLVGAAYYGYQLLTGDVSRMGGPIWSWTEEGKEIVGLIVVALVLGGAERTRS